MKDSRWVTIADSQFPHEKQGLDAVKQKLPDAEPFRAWANFEFRDNRGRWHEVDLLVLARDTLYLIELKHYRGILTGNDHLWRRNGRAEDSPLLLARRKAQYFASLLKDEIRRRGGNDAVSRIPYVQELVFLHHPELVCDLPESSKINLYGLDGHEKVTGLPGISKILLAPARHEPITDQNSQLIAGFDNVEPDRLIVRLPSDSTGRWWTWAGTAANRSLQASLHTIVDPRQRIDEKSVRLMSGVTVREFSEAMAAVEWRDPDVDANALRGLKFSSALPEDLAKRTLSARLGDRSHAVEVSTQSLSVVK